MAPENNTKRDRREAARETARLNRIKREKAQKRKKWYLQGGIAGGVIAVAVIVVLVISGNQNAAVVQTAKGPANMISDGILFTQGANNTTVATTTAAIKAKGKPTATTPSTKTTSDGKKIANIVTYIDPQCPFCNDFETTNASQIEDMVKAGTATLEVHPIAVLDRSSGGNRYSSRSVNALACVAQYDPNNFLAAEKALYAQQPAEGSQGMNNIKLTNIIKGSGANSSDVVSCIKNEEFKQWVTAATNRASTEAIPNSSLTSITGTPTVLVNGQDYSGSLTDKAAFADFVNSVVTS